MKKLLLILSISLIYTFNSLGQCPITVSQSGPVCFDNCNGWANVTAYGIPPYSYQWSNGAQMNFLNEICAGTYYITVTDSIGCIAIDSVTIVDLPLLDITIDTIVNTHCFGSSDGEIGVSASGGLPPYTFNWGDGQITNYVTGLTAGEYYPTVVDANGCSQYGYAYVNSPTEIYTNEMVSQTECTNPFGNISLYPAGGTPYTMSGSYIYQWSTLTNPNFSTLEQIYSLSPGLYTVTITDSLGCFVVETFEMNSMSGPVPTIIWSNVTCFGANNATVDSVNIYGGIPGYTYLWSTGLTTQLNPALLAPGNYWFQVTDTTGCSGYDYFTVTQPTAITNDPFQQNLSCFGDTTGYISLNINGGQPNQIYPYYDFVWTTGDSGNYVINQPAGTYSVTVTDLAGCTYTDTYTITSPDKLMIDSVLVSDVTCYGMGNGFATVFTSGGTEPYFYSIDSLMWNTSDTIQPLTAGNTYHVLVKDSSYCMAVSSNFMISEPPYIDITTTWVDPTCANNDGSINIVTTGGVPPFSIIWYTPSLTGFSVSGLSQGAYDATIADANGCINDLNFSLTQSSSPAVLTGSNYYSAGAFPPNEVEIYLFKENFNGAAEMDTVAVTTNSASVWAFSGLIPGIYYVKADLINPNTYPNILNTYFDSTYSWLNAIAIPITCDDTVNINLHMFEFTVMQSGTGTFTGNVRMVSQTKAVGEPVPGAEILIEQEPNEVPVQCAYTDTNGDYTVTGLMAGAEYGIKVDIPGFPLLSTYQNLTIGEYDTIPNLNFLVDTIVGGGIFVDTASYVSYINLDGVTAEIYPNPFTSNINVKVNLDRTGSVSYELFDALGKRVQMNDSGYLPAGEHEFTIAPEIPIHGACYLILHTDKGAIVKKLISKQ